MSEFGQMVGFNTIEGDVSSQLSVYWQGFLKEPSLFLLAFGFAWLVFDKIVNLGQVAAGNLDLNGNRLVPNHKHVWVEGKSIGEPDDYEHHAYKEYDWRKDKYVWRVGKNRSFGERF